MGWVVRTACELDEMLQIEQRDAQPPDVLNTRVATGEWEHDFPFFVVPLTAPSKNTVRSRQTHCTLVLTSERCMILPVLLSSVVQRSFDPRGFLRANRKAGNNGGCTNNRGLGSGGNQKRGDNLGGA